MNLKGKDKIKMAIQVRTKSTLVPDPDTAENVKLDTPFTSVSQKDTIPSQTSPQTVKKQTSGESAPAIVKVVKVAEKTEAVAEISERVADIADIPFIGWYKDKGKWVKYTERGGLEGKKGVGEIAVQWRDSDDGEWGPQTTAPAHFSLSEAMKYLEEKFNGKGMGTQVTKHTQYRVVEVMYAESATDGWEPKAQLVERSEEQVKAADNRLAAKKQKNLANIEKMKAKQEHGTAGGSDAVSPDGLCLCGCGEKVTKRFRPGHDSRLHGMQKKLEKAGQPSDEKAAAVALTLIRNGKKVPGLG